MIINGTKSMIFWQMRSLALFFWGTFLFKNYLLTKPWKTKHALLLICWFSKGIWLYQLVILRYKLCNIGIKGKLLEVIQSLSCYVKSCVKYDGVLSNYFSNEMGLVKGEVLSPLLFALYVNEFQVKFVKFIYSSIELQVNNIF